MTKEQYIYLPRGNFFDSLSNIEMGSTSLTVTDITHGVQKGVAPAGWLGTAIKENKGLPWNLGVTQSGSESSGGPYSLAY